MALLVDKKENTLFRSKKYYCQMKARIKKIKKECKEICRRFPKT
jgi:hypothetical protein